MVKCNLKVILAKRKMFMKELAEKCGMKPQYISDVAREEKYPGVENALKIANALGLEVGDIWEIKK